MVASRVRSTNHRLAVDSYLFQIVIDWYYNFQYVFKYSLHDFNVDLIFFFFFYQVTSSSCNELTETSLSPYEQQKRALPKPRSKSLRRDTARCRNKTPTRHFDVHSSSSPNRVSYVENSTAVLSPAVHFYEQQDNRLL